MDGWRGGPGTGAAAASIFRCETGKSRTFEGFAGKLRAIGFEASETRPVKRCRAFLDLFGEGSRGRQRLTALRFGAGEEFGGLVNVGGGADLNHPAVSRCRRAAARNPYEAAIWRSFYCGCDLIGAMRPRRGTRGRAHRGGGSSREAATLRGMAADCGTIETCLFPIVFAESRAWHIGLRFRRTGDKGRAGSLARNIRDK